MLEYQKLDGQLLNLERNLASDTNKQNLNKMISLVKDSQNKLLELETKAKNTITDFDKNQKEYESTFAELDKLIKLDISNLSEEELNKNINRLNDLFKSLTAIEKGVSTEVKVYDNKMDSNILDLENALETLESDEKKLIYDRYYNGYTQTELSKKLGISQVQISRKENKVLQKLKSTL